MWNKLYHFLYHFLSQYYLYPVLHTHDSFCSLVNSKLLVPVSQLLPHGVRSGMASIRLQQPEPFDFKAPDAWPKWKRRFEQFRVASGLSTADAEQQVNTLLYSMGEEADDVLSSTNITAEERKVYATVMEKFEGFFKVRKNIIFERARFNRRNQLEGETAEKYITELYRLVDGCEYAGLKEEMIRDRLVVGILDQELSEKLQLEPDLTLEGAKKSIRQKEAVKEQHQLLQASAGADPTLDEVSKTGWKGKSKNGTSGKTHSQQCTRCGRSAHSRGERCPATNVVCFTCKKRGHFEEHCFFRKMGKATTNEVCLDDAFLDAVGTNTEKCWMASVLLENKTVSFKLDTGAEVTAVSEETFKMLPKTPLKQPVVWSKPPTLNVLGQFTGKLLTDNHSYQDDIYVVRGLRNNLLGLPAIAGLQLVQRLCSTEAESDIKKQFPKVFNGLGTFGAEYAIKMEDGATPYALYTPRNVPIPLREKVKDELDRMEAMGVTTKISEPTQWCAGMVVVPKKSGKVRICVDLKPLNKSIMRETYPIPKVDDTLAQLTGARVFSKLDANSGFWQIPLAEESRPLTTFITPFGRYCFNKLPFGICSAPEVFQRRMQQILEGLPGVVCLIDDILIFGKDQEEHNSRLAAVLKRLEENNVTLNSEKCEFNKASIGFVGHLINSEGIRADPAKTSAISQMPAPQSLTELRRFMGMVNQLGKFSSKIAEIGQPLRELLSTKRTWVWGPAQEQAFTQIKEELVKPTVLALYDPNAKTVISADASSFGLGAVLMQMTAGSWKPVAYASRSMSDTERHYAQIEKEALAVTWACEKFSDYVLGCTFSIQTDHKPLVPLLNTKCLNTLPPRVLRFRLRLARFDYVVSHVPGKELYIADTLSRAPTGEADGRTQLQEVTEAYVREVAISSLPATSKTLDEYRRAQQQDPVCSTIVQFCRSGWPKAKSSVDSDLQPYWKVRDYLTVCEDLLLYRSRIVVPKSMQRMTMEKIHTGHQGVERCCWRARTSVWWPGVTHQITHMVQQCTTCAKEARQRKEPMLPTKLAT